MKVLFGMLNAIMLHGTSCTPDSYWQPQIRKFLVSKGYDVWAPQLPNPDTPDLDVQLPFVLKGGKFTERTVLIGHSAGSPLVLAVLESLTQRINKAILVAGYARPCEPDRKPEPILKAQYDWERIRNNVRDITFINSDNDPWGCNHEEGKYMFDHLGGRLIVLHGEGHMGSDTFKQPYKEFPLLEKLLEL